MATKIRPDVLTNDTAIRRESTRHEKMQHSSRDKYLVNYRTTRREGKRSRHVNSVLSCYWEVAREKCEDTKSDDKKKTHEKHVNIAIT